MFAAGDVLTRALSHFDYRANTVEVVAPGTDTTIQDCPGRTGHWDVGAAPSDPMDDYALRLDNRIVGNATDAASIECTLSGPTLNSTATPPAP